MTQEEEIKVPVPGNLRSDTAFGQHRGFQKAPLETRKGIASYRFLRESVVHGVRYFHFAITRAEVAK